MPSRGRVGRICSGCRRSMSATPPSRCLATMAPEERRGRRRFAGAGADGAGGDGGDADCAAAVALCNVRLSAPPSAGKPLVAAGGSGGKFGAARLMPDAMAALLSELLNSWPVAETDCSSRDAKPWSPNDRLAVAGMLHEDCAATAATAIIPASLRAFTGAAGCSMTPTAARSRPAIFRPPAARSCKSPT